MNPADPDELRRLAAGLDRHADDVRMKARQLVTAAAAMSWRGSAADVLRGEVHDKAGGMNLSAGELERCAGLLRAHAGVVEVEARALEVAEKAASGALDLVKKVFG